MSEALAILARVLESDEDFVGKDMDIHMPYGIGSRVKVTDGDYTGEPGTVMGMGNLGNNVRGFWVHLDGADDDINSAILYPADRLAPAHDLKYPPGILWRITQGEFAGRKAILTGTNKAGSMFVHVEGHPDDWQMISMRQNELEPLAESELMGDEDDVKAVAGYVTPELQLDTDPKSKNQQTFVYAYGEFIGTVSEDLATPGDWVVTFVPNKGYIWKRGFRTREDAAMAIWQDRIGMKKLREEVEDDEGFKDVYSGEYPTFNFLVKRDPQGREQWGSGVWNVYIDGSELGMEHVPHMWIGEIEAVRGEGNQLQGWRISNLPYPSSPKAIPELFPQQLDAARYIWGERLRPRNEAKDHQRVRRLVGKLIDEADEDEPDFKEFAFDPVASAVSALEGAGFKIERADREGDDIFLRFTWPAFNAVAYINGAKRALEAIRPFINVRHGDYRVDRELDEQGQKIARMFIRRKDDQAPWLWKIERIPNYYDHNVAPGDVVNTSAEYKIFFNGQEAGLFLAPNYDVAERVREEMAQLHKVHGFYPPGWDAPGNAWGKGHAIEWWRRNRKKLGNVARSNEPFFDRGLLATR